MCRVSPRWGMYGRPSLAKASRRVLGSREEYWVAGRSVGTLVNAMAIMATLASGGSIIGVMGLAYQQGIPATLALFAGAVLGFPLASILVARPRSPSPGCRRRVAGAGLQAPGCGPGCGPGCRPERCY